MKTFIIIIFIFINMSLFISFKTNNKIIKGFIPSIGLIIITTFLFGLFNILELSFYLIILLNIILFLINLYYIFIKKISIKEYITFELFLFLGIMLIAFLGFKDRLLFGWDEFSHWGTSTKNMFYLNSFFTNPKSTTMFNSYLPGANLLQYFFLKVNGNFSEGLLYFTNFFVIISLFIDIVSSLNTKKITEKFFMFGILLFVPTIFYVDAYINIQVDLIMGICFFYVLYNYFYQEHYSIKIYSLVSILFLLSLLKDISILLVFGFVLLVLLKKTIQNPKLKTIINKDNLKYLLYFIPIVLWKIHLNFLGIASYWSNKVSIGTVIKGIFSSTKTYHYDVLKNFFKFIFKENISYIVPFTIVSFIIIVLFLTSLYIILVESKKEKKINSYILWSLIFGFLIYLIVLLILYMTKFSEYEALILASFSRYVSTYLSAIFLLIALLCLKKIMFNNKKSILYITGISFIIITYMQYTPTFAFTGKTFISNAETIIKREQFNKFIDQYSYIDNYDNKLYFISENTNGETYYITRYLATPMKINATHWSIAKKYSDNDLWSSEKSLEQWRTELYNDYEYVYIEKLEEEFINKFKSLFVNEITSDTLYKINKNGDDLKLVRVKDADF